MKMIYFKQSWESRRVCVSVRARARARVSCAVICVCHKLQHNLHIIIILNIFQILIVIIRRVAILFYN